jgi:hypothetical protein
MMADQDSRGTESVIGNGGNGNNDSLAYERGLDHGSLVQSVQSTQLQQELHLSTLTRIKEVEGRIEKEAGRTTVLEGRMLAVETLTTVNTAGINSATEKLSYVHTSMKTWNFIGAGLLLLATAALAVIGWAFSIIYPAIKKGVIQYYHDHPDAMVTPSQKGALDPSDPVLAREQNQKQISGGDFRESLPPNPLQ